MPALTVAADPEGAAEAAAELLARFIDEARSARGEAHVGMAGGRTPRRTYELLAKRLDTWDGVHLWFSDERVVSPLDPASNHAMVVASLLALADVPEERVHRVPVERGAGEAAALYAAELAALVPSSADGVPTLDVALLGLGEDGHTASLFAGGPGLAAGSGSAVPVDSAPKPPPERVTLTVELLAAARAVIFLAVGADKRPAVEAVLSGADPAVPASLVAGGRSELIVDAEAAPVGDLEREPSREANGATGGIHHVALEVRERDADACRDFFALLGFAETRPPEGLLGRARWLERDRQHVHLLLTDSPTVPPGGHLALVVEDYQGALYALRAAGHPAEPATEHWGSPRAFARGPAGHVVELMAFPPA
jgi:6-phosphogluconolactonase